MIDIKLIYNVTARPDLGTIGTFELNFLTHHSVFVIGIENLWSVCKSRFRASVDKLRAVNIPFDNYGLV